MFQKCSSGIHLTTSAEGNPDGFNGVKTKMNNPVVDTACTPVSLPGIKKQYSKVLLKYLSDREKQRMRQEDLCYPLVYPKYTP